MTRRSESPRAQSPPTADAPRAIVIWLAIAVAAGLLAARPSLAHEGTIMTVNGAIEPGELGRTLTHEHILVDFIGAEQSGPHRWDRGQVAAVVLPHLVEARELGFDALIECTPAHLGRDPLLLRELAARSGLHLLTNTGYYGARGNLFIPDAVKSLDADALAARWVAEYESGIGDSGVRPGFIKIAVDRKPQLDPLHQRLLRAACRAHLRSGLTIACHTGPGETIWKLAEILEDEGVAPEAFIWVHANLDQPHNLVRAARHGLWVSIDNVRPQPKIISAIAARLDALRAAGLLDRVLLSHDAGWYRPGEPGGGEFRDYTALSRELIPALRASGFSARTIDRMLVDNARRAFTIGVRKAR